MGTKSVLLSSPNEIELTGCEVLNDNYMKSMEEVLTYFSIHRSSNKVKNYQCLNDRCISREN